MALIRNDIATARNAMVDDLVQRRVIRTAAVERAFRRVARHQFLPAPYLVRPDPLSADTDASEDPTRVYADVAIVLDAETGAESIPPSVAAHQIEELGPIEGMRLLHVGIGGGYYTAVLAEIVGERGTIIALEYDEVLSERSAMALGQAGYTMVTVQQGDGGFGRSAAAPFDGILVSAGAADIAPAWIEQLEESGRLVLPLCHRSPLSLHLAAGAMLTVEKSRTGLMARLTQRILIAPLAGAYEPAAEAGQAVADGLQHWFALEEFMRSDAPIRIEMKPGIERPPDPDSVPWLLETPHTLMWIEPN